MPQFMHYVYPVTSFPSVQCHPLPAAAPVGLLIAFSVLVVPMCSHEAFAGDPRRNYFELSIHCGVLGVFVPPV